MQNRISIIFIFIALALMVHVLPSTHVFARAEDGEVHIPDVNLRVVILRTINAKSHTPDAIITQAEMSTLIGLDASIANINDLTGLEYATHLKWLSLRSNNISDITPLSGLNNLTDLQLDNNSISDIIPLSGLNNLTDLRLDNNSISNITPLSK